VASTVPPRSRTDERPGPVQVAGGHGAREVPRFRVCGECGALAMVARASPARPRHNAGGNRGVLGP
jgi:hypothetical protein